MKTPIVTAEDLGSLIDRGEKVVFLDATHPDVWVVSGRKVGDAVRLDQEKVGIVTRTLPKDTRFVIYASGADELPAMIYAMTLRQQGFSNAHALAGGAAAWAKLGLAKALDGAGTLFPSRW